MLIKLVYYFMHFIGRRVQALQKSSRQFTFLT